VELLELPELDFDTDFVFVEDADCSEFDLFSSSSSERLSVKLVKSSISALTPSTPSTPAVISPEILFKVLVIQDTLCMISPIISGIKPLAAKIRSLFFELLQGDGVFPPPSEVMSSSASGSTPLMALIAFDVSDEGLSVQSLIKGSTPTTIMLDKALALELATVPVATRVVGGTVIERGTGVGNAPPIITGIN